jgi:RNA 2',3'-cyclic 3'-phosphodiesterase
MRVFVAIDMSPDLKLALQSLIREVRRGASGVKWVEPGAMHLTLKFLGEVSEDGLPAIGDALAGAAAGRSPFPIRLKGTGTFPPGWRKSARVLWVGVPDGPRLLDLQSGLESLLETAGFPREDRPFHPHLTLGRVKSSDGLERVLQALETRATDDFGEMTVSRITLFQSVLKPSGPVYVPLREETLR